MIVCSSWGILLSQHQRVKLVSEALTVLGVDHFIPLIESLKIVRGRHIRERRPLLGNYIPFAVDASWKSLMRLRGVAGIMLNDCWLPAQVLQSEMERLHAMCDDSVYRSSVVEKHGFEYGQRVSPKEGPFAYHTGRYDGKANKRGDVAALFQLFGREQRVVFKSGDLLAV